MLVPPQRFQDILPFPCEGTGRRWSSASKKRLSHLDLGFLDPQNRRERSGCCLGHAVAGILLRQAEHTNVIGDPTKGKLGSPQKEVSVEKQRRQPSTNPMEGPRPDPPPHHPYPPPVMSPSSLCRNQALRSHLDHRHLPSELSRVECFRLVALFCLRHCSSG